MQRLLPYQLSLVVRGLRRAPGLSLSILIGLALAGAVWTTISAHYLRFYGARPALSPALHQVELPHSQTLGKAFNGSSNGEPNGWAARTRVSFPEYERLAASRIPTRQAATVRARVLTAAEGGGGIDSSEVRVMGARFVTADFFSMFAIPLGAGRPFTADEDHAGDAVVVIGRRLAEALFGASGALGRTVLVEGRRFRVVGTLERDQPFRPDWDIANMGANQDALYLPFAWFQRLAARPELVLYQSPPGWRFEDLVRSDAVFVVHWVELPTRQARAAYVRLLDERFGRAGARYTLRSWAEWQAAFPIPTSTITFFTLIGGLVLVGSGLNMARLLLAKGGALHEELAIHRALGATRLTLFARQIAEALLLSAAAALASVLVCIPYNGLFNRLVADTDIPVMLTPKGVLFGAAGVLATGVVAALYPAWRLSRIAPAVHVGRA